MKRDELMQAAYDEYFSTGYDPTGGEIDEMKEKSTMKKNSKATMVNQTLRV